MPMHLGSLIKLNGTNFEEWMELVKLFLAISCVDSTFTEDEPSVPTATSSAEEKKKYDRWIHSNKICLMTMKHNMEKTIKDNIPKGSNAKKFDKTEKSTYLSLLTKIKYDGIGGVREHVMKLTN